MSEITGRFMPSYHGDFLIFHFQDEIDKANDKPARPREANNYYMYREDQVAAFDTKSACPTWFLAYSYKASEDIKKRWTGGSLSSMAAAWFRLLPPDTTQVLIRFDNETTKKNLVVFYCRHLTSEQRAKL